MVVPQVLTGVKLVVGYLDKMYIDQGKNIQISIKEIHKEIENFNQEVFKNIEHKIIELKEGKVINPNVNSNISEYLNINEIAQETENLVSKLSNTSERIKKESTDSEELLSYFKAIKKYFELFQKDTFEQTQYESPIRKKIVTRLLGLTNLPQEQAEAVQIIHNFKNTLCKHYIEIKIKYVDLDHNLSKHWTSRKLKRLFYKFQKNPLGMTALLISSTTVVVGTSIYIFSNYSNIQFYIQYRNLPKKEFFYSRSGTWDDINKAIVENKELANLKLNPSPFDPRTAVPRLIKGELDFVQSTTAPSPEQYKEAKDIDVKLKAVPVGYYLIAIAVNQEVRISSITVPELGKIYTGEINNWKQLGGQDLKITPYKLSDKHPNSVFFRNFVLRNKEFSKRVVTVNTNTEALQKLKQKDLGGIYFGSASEIVDQCLINTLSVSYTKEDEPVSSYQEADTYNSKCARKTRKQSLDGLRKQYPLTRQIFVIYRENEKGNGIGNFYTSWLLSKKGQKLIKDANFIPIQ
jgi:phosphate transport system substrate-binding protein